MEIYKLTDKVSDGNASGDDMASGREILTNKHKCDIMGVEALENARVSYVITDLKQGVKNPNRVNIYVNEKYAFSLEISQVVDLGVKKGFAVSEVELAELKKASEFGKLYQRALEWCLVRPRSEREVYDYLYKKIYEKKLDKKYINEIIEKLKGKKYLDDEKFAEYYVENRFVKKGISAKRLRMELTRKGVSKDVIDAVLENSERDDAAEIKKIIAKKRAKYDDEKLIAYLCRQGFSYGLVKELVEESSSASAGA